MKASPYLIFNGNGLEAIKHYEKAFKIKAERICQYKDTPPIDGMPPIPPEIAELIMHSVLPIGNSTIYICDTTPDQPTVFGKGSFPCVELDTVEDVISAFEILKENGKIFCEAQETFWNPCYAEIEDRFGLKWTIMVVE